MPRHDLERDHAVAIDAVAPRSRRAILAAGVGGAIATVASALGRPAPARAANGDPMLLGVSSNAATSVTSLLTTSASENGLTVGIAWNGGTGRAIGGFASD